MSTILFLIGWYILGIIGSVISLDFYKRRSHKEDITTDDLFFVAYTGIFGPVAILAGVFFIIDYLLYHLYRRIPRKTILKAKKKDI